MLEHWKSILAVIGGGLGILATIVAVLSSYGARAETAGADKVRLESVERSLRGHDTAIDALRADQAVQMADVAEVRTEIAHIKNSQQRVEASQQRIEGAIMRSLAEDRKGGGK